MFTLSQQTSSRKEMRNRTNLSTIASDHPLISYPTNNMKSIPGLRTAFARLHSIPCLSNVYQNARVYAKHALTVFYVFPSFHLHSVDVLLVHYSVFYTGYKEFVVWGILTFSVLIRELWMCRQTRGDCRLYACQCWCYWLEVSCLPERGLSRIRALTLRVQHFGSVYLSAWTRTHVVVYVGGVQLPSTHVRLNNPVCVSMCDVSVMYVDITILLRTTFFNYVVIFICINRSCWGESLRKGWYYTKMLVLSRISRISKITNDKVKYVC